MVSSRTVSSDLAPEVGILMLNTSFPRFLGDVGHANTFDFPVRRFVVERATSENVVLGEDGSLVADFVAASVELEKEGVRALATSCGFLARYQRELAAAVRIPVATSSLLLLPLVFELVGGGGCVGVLTARSSTLHRCLFKECGAAEVPVAVYGMEESEFSRVYVGNASDPDLGAIRKEFEDKAALMVEEHPDMRAVLLECTNMPPFSETIGSISGLPVFDVRMLVTMLHTSVSSSGKGRN